MRAKEWLCLFARPDGTRSRANFALHGAIDRIGRVFLPRYNRRIDTLRAMIVGQVEHFAEETIMDQGGEETDLREAGPGGTGGVGGPEVQRGPRNRRRSEERRPGARRECRGRGRGTGSRRWSGGGRVRRGGSAPIWYEIPISECV